MKLKTDTDSVAYVIGMNVGMNLMKMDSTINVNAVCEGIRDVFRQGTKFSAADAEVFYLRYMNYALPEKARAYEEQVPAGYPQGEPQLRPHRIGRDLYGRGAGRSGADPRFRTVTALRSAT